MANELKHATVGVEMTQAEFEATALHAVDSAVTGYLLRVGIGGVVEQTPMIRTGGDATRRAASLYSGFGTSRTLTTETLALADDSRDSAKTSYVMNTIALNNTGTNFTDATHVAKLLLLDGIHNRPGIMNLRQEYLELTGSHLTQEGTLWFGHVFLNNPNGVLASWADLYVTPTEDVPFHGLQLNYNDNSGAEPTTSKIALYIYQFGTRKMTLPIFVRSDVVDAYIEFRTKANEPLWQVNPSGEVRFFDPDIAHGITTVMPTTGYGKLSALSGTTGGLDVVGLSDDAAQSGVRLLGIIGVADPTDTTPAIRLRANKKNGTGIQALGAAETVLTIQNDATQLVTVLGNGKTGFGTPTPSTLLELLGADNTTVQTITINAAQAAVTAADTFIDFRSTTGSEASIAGTAAAGVIAYNTFTGTHFTQIDNRAGLEVGMLLEMVDGAPMYGKRTRLGKQLVARAVDGKEEPEIVEEEFTEEFQASPKAHLFKCRISQTKGSKAAIGAWLGTDKEGRDMVAALGTGILWTANKGKNIGIGDYLQASDVAGYAELQLDDVYRASTVAKATQSVVWVVGETRRLINVSYLGG